MEDIPALESSFLRFETWEEALASMREEYSHALEERAQLDRKIHHSRLEVDRLANRNASVTASLQKVQMEFDTTSREDIQAAYDAALDAQQRLFIMRGQLDKLEQERESLQKYIDVLESVDKFSGSSSAAGGAGSSGFAGVEMIIQGQETERSRLSKQMHDGPAQALSNFILQAEIATRLFDVDQDRAREELRVMKEAASTTFQQVRDFIFQLRPMMLDDLGVIPTVRRYVETVRTQSGLDIELTVTGEEKRLEPHLEVVVFRSLQELLGNAVQHSHGDEIEVQLDISNTEVSVSVEDNGEGFDVNDENDEGAVGLNLIRDRAEMLGGYFEIDSVIDEGTRILLRIPMVRPE